VKSRNIETWALIAAFIWFLCWAIAFWYLDRDLQTEFINPVTKSSSEALEQMTGLRIDQTSDDDKIALITSLSSDLMQWRTSMDAYQALISLRTVLDIAFFATIGGLLAVRCLRRCKADKPLGAMAEGKNK
jgi:hypothetical protein